jgi:hypothetical protein
MSQPQLKLTLRLGQNDHSQQTERFPKRQRWWGPVWRGLTVEPTAKHYRAMRASVWLYLYFIIHADRKTGMLFRRIQTIADEMGVSRRTICSWLSILRRHQYITTKSTGRALKIAIEKWKPVVKPNGT